MQLHFTILAFLMVFTVCNLTPSHGVPACQTPLKYGSFQVLVSENCTAQQDQWVIQQSTCKECMYIDSQGRKAIGVDFNLEQTDANAILTNFGVDYDKIVRGATTGINTPCACDEVVCLTNGLIESIFEESIANAIATVKRVMPAAFQSLCCTGRSVVVDIAFALGYSTFSTYKPLFFWLKDQNWQAASDYLRTTKWCESSSSRSRCEQDADNLQYPGCPCSGEFPVSCYETVSSCCRKDQPCCNASVPMNNSHQIYQHQELLCCPYLNGSCCNDVEENKCCPQDCPKCCLPNFCCGVNDYCHEGQCYTQAGFPAHNAAAKALIFPQGT